MAVLTIKHYTDIIDNFINGVVNNHKSYYVFIGKSDPWLDVDGNTIDTTPPQANTSLFEYESVLYRDMIFGKKIMPDDITYMVPNFRWIPGVVYDHYDQNDPNLYDKVFYVVTDKSEVYKCIFNNYGAYSTVKPDQASTEGVFSTSDGYVWKYLYTISTNANTKFSSGAYIPIVANTDVRDAAVNGSIDFIRVDLQGVNYQTYHEGFLTAYVNNYVVQLASNASHYTNFYAGSSIYLKAGYGAGQIRDIRNYNGLTRQIITTTPFDAYAQISLADINNGSSIVVDQRVTQRFEDIGFNHLKGYFATGDTVVQSDTGAYGTIATANATVMKIVKQSSNTFSRFLPIYNTVQSAVLKNGTVTVNANTLYVNAVSGTYFANDYSTGDYIRVGDENIRRVTAVNSSVITVDTVFPDTLVANNNYKMPYAANPTSIIILHANGYVHDLNLNGIQLGVSNAQALGIRYIIGENVDMVDINDVNQLANGIVAFSNSTTVILTNIQGTFATTNYLLGHSSTQKTYIDAVVNNPTVTISDPTGSFIAGQKIYFRPSDDLFETTQVANATALSVYFTPNELTEYIVSPKVTITGDGYGAMAYSVVNNSANGITSIVVTNTGTEYTYANISITANTLYGVNAIATPIISPVHGHGYDIVKELGARYAGVSVTFDTIVNESYRIPGYNEYRRIGIIEDPLFDDVTVELDSFDRIKLTLENNNGYSFANGEIAIQEGNEPYSYGIVTYYDPLANSSYLELQNVKGEFAANVSYDGISGLTSGAFANVKIAKVSQFVVLNSNVEIVSELTSNATATISVANPDTPYTVKLTNVSGSFDVNDTMVEPASNSYANVVAIYAANGTTDVSTVFGRQFNQTARITLTSHYGIFQKLEYINQAVTKARGRIIDINTEFDVTISDSTGNFVIGDEITDANSAASGIVTYANSTYLKMTSVNGEFFAGDTINNSTESALIDNVYQVLVLDDVSGKYKFSTSSNVITGEVSGAFGTSQIANTITYPDLIRDSGSVTYLENVAPFARSNTSKEKISLVIKF